MFATQLPSQVNAKNIDAVAKVPDTSNIYPELETTLEIIKRMALQSRDKAEETKKAAALTPNMKQVTKDNTVKMVHVGRLASTNVCPNFGCHKSLKQRKSTVTTSYFDEIAMPCLPMNRHCATTYRPIQTNYPSMSQRHEQIWGHNVTNQHRRSHHCVSMHTDACRNRNNWSTVASNTYNNFGSSQTSPPFITSFPPFHVETFRNVRRVMPQKYSYPYY